MRAFIIGLLALRLLPISTLADSPSHESEAKIARIEDELPETGAAPLPENAGDGSTIFNGINVPPMKELEGHKWEEQTKDGYWFVKHYSPTCVHCINFAPTWQKIYEFYYVGVIFLLPYNRLTFAIDIQTGP